MDYSFQGRHPPSQLAAMAASFHQNSDPQWYANSGATNHLTNDLSNLSLQSGYQGKDQVTVGNGRGLNVSHTGSSILHLSPPTSFKLNKALCVPHIATNLLLVNQFSKDNNCLFIFDAHGFSIQDRTTRRTLFRGLSKNGLYPFPTFNTTPSIAALLGVTTSASIWHGASVLSHSSQIG